MSRIPFAQIQGGVVSVDAPPMRAADAQADPSAGVAQMAIARAAGVTADLTDKWLQARSSVEVSNGITNGSAELDAYRGELQNDPDHASRAQKFAAKVEEVRAKGLDGLTDPRSRDDYNVRFNRISRPMTLQVQQAARDEELQVFRMQTGDQLDTLATRSVMAKSEPERLAIQEEARNIVEDAVRTGRMTAVGARTMQRAYLGKVDAALASEMVRTNPGAAIAALGDPERFKYLDASARVQLRAQATNRAESLGAQARAELRADIHDMNGALAAGQPVAQADYEKLLARAGGAKTAAGTLLTRSWNFYQRVNTETTDKNIPQLAAAVAALSTGAPRTHDGYAPLKNPDGSISTEISVTVTDPRLNDGRPTNIPSLWEGKVVGQDEAVTRAVQSRRQFQSFDTIDSAVAAAVERSNAGGAGAATQPTTDDLHLARVVKSALDRKVAERDKDPAGYSLKYYPTVNEQLVRAQAQEQGNDELARSEAPDLRQGAWQTMVDVQRAEGVPEHKIALLTNTQADELRNRLLTADGQNRVDLVQGMRQQFGEQWSRVKAQLSHGHSLPPDIEVLASMPPGANLPAVTITEAYKIGDKQAGEILGGKRLVTIDEAVRGQVADMATTMVQAPGGPEKLATFQNAVERVARLYAIRGESDANAAKRAAADVFYDHWETLGTVRIPKQEGQPVVPTSAVRLVQGQVIDALPKMELALPDAGSFRGLTEAQRRDMLVRNVKSFGYWMTTADDKGMVLLAGPGLPVRFADGRPLVVPFDAALAAAGDRGARDAYQMRWAGGIDETTQGGQAPADDAPGWLERLLGGQRPAGAFIRNRMERSGPVP